MTTSVLYDVPGPRAITRNRILGVITVLVVLALIAYVVYQLAVTGQLTAKKWSAFGYAIIWQQVFDALWATIRAFLLAAVGSLVLGFLLAIARLSDHKWVRWPAVWVVEILRAVPVLIMMMLLYYGLPVVGVRMEPYWAVVIALIAYNGSVLAEVFRSGVESLPRGQSEAGYAIGLRKGGVLMSILMPQAIRAMLPVIISQLVVTLKDTALGSIITYNELLYLARFLGSQQDLGRPIIPTTIVIGAIYIIICLLLSWLAVIVQRRISASPRLAPGTEAAAALAGEGTQTELIGTQQGDLLAEIDGGPAGPVRGGSAPQEPDGPANGTS